METIITTTQDIESKIKTAFEKLLSSLPCDKSSTKDTPDRYFKALSFMLNGYNDNPEKYIKIFELSEYNQMVTLNNINFVSLCEHHILPFFGMVKISYIPNGKVIGVSKLVRLVRVFSKRLQIQERLTEQISTAINDNLLPLGCGVQIKAKHLCMIARGVEENTSEMITVSLKGNFFEQSVKNEFLKA